MEARFEDTAAFSPGRGNVDASNIVPNRSTIRELKVAPIRNGYVIDHIPAGRALDVLIILGVTEKNADCTVAIIMHVP
ncbi:MAG: aspartate carbamoyltransferase regulatory subunit, partial [Thermoplasmata archaeon]|nr:aspartate carbamoyltransferase regulatory subunit [Thermoplasmata archaeon]